MATQDRQGAEPTFRPYIPLPPLAPLRASQLLTQGTGKHGLHWTTRYGSNHAKTPSTEWRNSSPRISDRIKEGEEEIERKKRSGADRAELLLFLLFRLLVGLFAGIHLNPLYL